MIRVDNYLNNRGINAMLLKQTISINFSSLVLKKSGQETVIYIINMLDSHLLPLLLLFSIYLYVLIL